MKTEKKRIRKLWGLNSTRWREVSECPSLEVRLAPLTKKALGN